MQHSNSFKVVVYYYNRVTNAYGNKVFYERIDRTQDMQTQITYFENYYKHLFLHYYTKFEGLIFDSIKIYLI